MPQNVSCSRSGLRAEREINALLAAFDRVVADGAAELVLVTGYSGIGKSSVVNELHKALVPSRAIRVWQIRSVQARHSVRHLGAGVPESVRHILGKGEVELGEWRDALREALGANGSLIVNLVPELELVIGKQPPVPDLPPQDAKNRFQMVFRRFLGVFAREEHPLTLVLDDLQGLDAATLDLLEHLFAHAEPPHLMLVGAYRDNEVGPAHPLLRALEAIRNRDCRSRKSCWRPSDTATSDNSSPTVCIASRSVQGHWRVSCTRKPRQSVFRDPIHHGFGRRGAARVRPRRPGLAMGHGSHPRQGLHR